MWHTPAGDRVLTGPEAALLKAAATRVAELIREETSGHGEQWEYEITVFDSLGWTQRLALLDRVMTYLLTSTPKPIPLTAVNEAAVGALFEQIKVDLALEADAHPELGTTFRELVLAAYRASVSAADREADEKEEELPAVNARSHEEWEILVEVLEDRILWDRDFDMEDLFLDADPDRIAVARHITGIDPEYFSDAVPDALSDEGAKILLHRLEQLAGPEPQ